MFKVLAVYFILGCLWFLLVLPREGGRKIFRRLAHWGLSMDKGSVRPAGFPAQATSEAEFFPAVLSGSPASPGREYSLRLTRMKRLFQLGYLWSSPLLQVSASQHRILGRDRESQPAVMERQHCPRLATCRGVGLSLSFCFHLAILPSPNKEEEFQA